MFRRTRYTLQKFLDQVYKPARLAGKSTDTLRLYGVSIRNFGRCLGRTPKLSDVTDDKLARFRDWTLERGRSAATANKDVSQLLALGRFAHKKGLLTEHPDCRLATEPTRAPRAWLAEDLRRLMISCELQTGDVAGVPAADWWVALHCVIWDTGERVGAILQLPWSNLDRSDGWLIVGAETRKFGNADKAFRLHEQTLERLDKIRQPKRELIFPWALAPCSLYLHYNKILERASLPTDRKSKFHRVRKSVASHAKAAGLNPTEILGHSSSKVTAAYLDPRIGENVQPSDVLFRPLGRRDTQGRLFE